jgi:hypothetical protein
MNEFVAVSLVAIVMILMLRGFLIVFSKQFWLALLMLIVFFPLLVLWALVEGFFNWR